MQPPSTQTSTRTLHVVERLEQRRDESGRKLKEARQLSLERVVVELVVLRRLLELLLYLEHILRVHAFNIDAKPNSVDGWPRAYLFVAEGLVLLFSQLGVVVVVPVKVNQLRPPKW